MRMRETRAVALPRRTAMVMATIHLFTAVLVAFGVFVALPARWWPVDTAAVALVAVEAASGLGLAMGAPWAVRVARASAAAALALGLLTVSLLAATASWLSGIYGPVGRGGGIVLACVAALVLPYLVGAPILQLLWLQPTSAAGPAPE